MSTVHQELDLNFFTASSKSWNSSLVQINIFKFGQSTFDLFEVKCSAQCSSKMKEYLYYNNFISFIEKNIAHTYDCWNIVKMHLYIEYLLSKKLQILILYSTKKRFSLRKNFVIQRKYIYIQSKNISI